MNREEITGVLEQLIELNQDLYSSASFSKKLLDICERGGEDPEGYLILIADQKTSSEIESEGECWFVLEVHERGYGKAYVKFNGWYDSWSGDDVNYSDEFDIVSPQYVQRVDWEKV